MKLKEEEEGIISRENLMHRVRKGSIVVLNNSRGEEVLGIGEGLMTKVNANVGISKDDIAFELKKVEAAINSGADTVMDLSVKDFDESRRKILKYNIPVGTVPVYQAYIEKKADLDSDHIFKVIEKNLKDGVSFATIHAGITLNIVKQMKKDSRLIPITSRGGAMMAAWMLSNNSENPLFKDFDTVLELFKEYDAAISLGDALRPGSVHDSTDYAQISELLNLGMLTKRARKKNVKIIIEGPGHIPLNEIEANVKIAKKICDNSPLYTLGPIVTDIALGYDHISSAIGGAFAAMWGVDFLCYVTPSEHFSLPSVEDVKLGVISAKIAAHSADICKLNLRDEDFKISKAREDLDWANVLKHGIDKNLERNELKNLKNKVPCTMCGEYCALEIVRRYFE